MNPQNLGRIKKYGQILGAVVNPKKYFIYPKRDYSYHEISFSQEGEDRILSRIFCNQESGFYVDIGAHHPQRFSNTYLFYLKGWNGINIDAMPGSMKIFNQKRPDDINLEFAISDTEETLTYYMFNESALNGFSRDISASRDQSGDYKIVDTRDINVRKLSAILDEYLPLHQTIDFLNVDVEGFDYQVLLSNDWSKYRPKILMVEELLMNPISGYSKIGIFLKSQGYELFSKTFNTSFYRLVITQPIS
jgi:FkbM family methyltransferase